MPGIRAVTLAYVVGVPSAAYRGDILQANAARPGLARCANTVVDDKNVRSIMGPLEADAAE